MGATGSCGRQVAAQLLEQGTLTAQSRLHLIGHAGGQHVSELWGLRADLRDAFADRAPIIDVGTDAAQTDADIVIMMAGATVSRDSTDRAALAEKNRKIFQEVAGDVARMDHDTTIVVQSNPVELAMSILGEHAPRHRVLGAAAWSDSLRFRRELAADLGVTRPMVHAEMWGQHGDHLVPMWSLVRARGVSTQHLADAIGTARAGRSLADLPDEIRATRTRALDLINADDIAGSYAFIEQQPADLRAAVKPFFTHFTAGRTTELATAHAVVEVTDMIVRGQRRAIPAQVRLEGEQWGVSGILGVGILTDHHGWSEAIPADIADDEGAALHKAAEAIKVTNAA